MNAHRREAIAERASELVKLVCGEGLVQGAEVWYRAPYRKDDHPSLRWNPSKRVWFDDPADRGGDIFDLVALARHLDAKTQFPLVLEAAEQVLGISVPSSSRSVQKPDSLKGRTESPLARLATQYGLDEDDFIHAGCSIAGSDVSYPLLLPDGSTGKKLKSLVRKNGGKRSCRIVPSGSGASRGLFGTDPRSVAGGPLILTGGEEKALAAIKAGFHACSLATGEKAPHLETARFLSSGAPSEVIVCFDADDAGRKGAAAAVQVLLQSCSNCVKFVDWPVEASKGFDLNDLLRSEGLEGVRRCLQNAIMAKSDDSSGGPDAVGVVARCTDIANANRLVQTAKGNWSYLCDERAWLHWNGRIWETTREKPTEPPPSCPKCGAPMVTRTAKKGANAGQQFLGCSTYPKCSGTREISTRQ